MKVSVRSNRKSVTYRKGQKTGGVSIKRLGKSGGAGHNTGTVVMTNVRFGQSIMGELVEENEAQIRPRSQRFMNVSSWPTARYIGRLGYYIDTDTHERVTSATAVYVVGDTIYYM